MVRTLPNFCVVLCIFVLFYYFCVVLCIVCFVSFSALFVCICVLYYCHRVATQLQLNISYIKTRKDGGRPALFLIFVLFYVFLCSMYCLFYVVICIVCVYMCTVLLPPGGYPIAVKYIKSFFLEISTIKDETTRLSRNVGGFAPHPRKQT